MSYYLGLMHNILGIFLVSAGLFLLIVLGVEVAGGIGVIVGLQAIVLGQLYWNQEELIKKITELKEEK